MERKALIFLKKWLTSPRRLPLVIRGARQVGKTWLVRHLAQATERQLVEINFEKDPIYATYFQSNNPETILLNLSDAFGSKIDPDSSILFLDEIQAAPDLYQKLRWFSEDMPQLPVIAAGSLLEVIVSEKAMSMPVGRINYMHLEPFTFEEFLAAQGMNTLCDRLAQFTFGDQIPEATHEMLLSLFKDYIIIGGMPSAIEAWIESKSLLEVSNIHRGLLTSYREEFDSYSGRLTPKRLDEVFEKVPLFLGKKFVYSRVNEHAKIESISRALTLLCKARVCHKVFATGANGVPLGSEKRERFFKTIFLDVGLVSSLLKLSYNEIKSVQELTLINAGGIAEQVVGQLLRTLNPYFEEPELFYWLRDEFDGQAEIDYVVQHAAHVIPIEVKAGSSGTLKSLHFFMEKKKHPYAVRIYSGPLQKGLMQTKGTQQSLVSYTLHSLPFYLIEQLHRLLD